MLLLNFQKDFYNEKTRMGIFADFCVLVSTGAMVGWGGDTLQCGAAVFLGQSRGGWSPLNDPDVFQLPLCPLAAFHLSPKSGVTRPSPSKTDWVTQACWLLPVAHGSGQRCHCGCFHRDSSSRGSHWNVPAPWDVLQRCRCGGYGGQREGTRQAGQHLPVVWGAATVAFDAPHPQCWAADKRALTTAGFPGKNNSAA